MTKIRVLYSVIVVSCIMCGCSGISNRSERLEYEKQIDRAILSHGFDGTILVADNDGIIFERAYGYSDGSAESDPETATSYEVGSLTKQFTAAAILRLAEDGKLKLDDKLSIFYPECEWSHEFTVSDLLNMNTRIPDYKNNCDFALITTKKEVESEILSYTIGNEVTGYCNSNYYLLGLIIEEVSQMTYEDYISTVLLAPAGLKDTGINTDYKSFAAGAMYSNVYDMYNWNKAYFDGEIIPEKYLSELEEKESGYLYGFRCEPDTYYHEGHTDNFSSYMKYNKNSGIYVILLSNENNQGISNYGNEVYEITIKYLEQ